MPPPKEAKTAKKLRPKKPSQRTKDRRKKRRLQLMEKPDPRCFYCGHGFDPGALGLPPKGDRLRRRALLDARATLEHLVPVSKGGTLAKGGVATKTAEAPMAERNDDLHGSAPDSHPVALLLVDVITPCDLPEADDFLRNALPAAKKIAALKRRAGVPVIYANDNFGRWRSDLKAVVERCLEPGCKGKPLCEALRPGEQDYFVLKPKHSAFYSTTLDVLLRALWTRSLVVCGFAGNICVLFTANDAYMRDFRVVVPSDCVASNTKEENETALSQMAKVLKADIRQSEGLDFSGRE